LRVLIVDDFVPMRLMLCDLISEIGVQHVDAAPDGAAALEMLRRAGTYDLIISDWNMEPVTGLELLERVRADATLGNLPFIMVSADGCIERVVTARAAGASFYLVKPFNAGTLKAAIIEALRSASADR
jgi:two-component system chemotaxis response regulator CheY